MKPGRATRALAGSQKRTRRVCADEVQAARRAHARKRACTSVRLCTCLCSLRLLLITASLFFPAAGGQLVKDELGISLDKADDSILGLAAKVGGTADGTAAGGGGGGGGGAGGGAVAALVQALVL